MIFDESDKDACGLSQCLSLFCVGRQRKFKRSTSEVWRILSF